MRKILLSLFLITTVTVFSQPVELQLFVRSYTAASTQLGVRVRAKTSTLSYIGATFYILYQSANASPASFDDSKLVTTYAWGSSNRFTNPTQAVNITAEGKTYDRRYVYGNADEAAGTNAVTLKTTWDTVVYITFNNLQTTAPQGGYAYAQKTSDPGATGVALTDPLFANISIDATSGAVALAAVPLPVQFTRFDVECRPDKGSRITWATSQESNNGYFEVERTINGTDWTSVGKVTAASHSAAERNYQLTDPQGGTAQYRLKQVDRDGKTTYSAIVKSTCEGRNVFVTLYPVPAREVLNLVIGSEKAAKTRLQVFDTKGRLALTMPVTLATGINNYTLPVHGLAAGEYILRSTEPGVEINKRFTVLR